MEIMSASSAAQRWGISQRRVAILCAEGRVEGAERVGNMWIIPQNTPKPVDGRTLRYEKQTIKEIKPFVKWAGGKGQLLPEIKKLYPAGLGTTITKYVEPFVGGGAVLFDVLSRFDIAEIYISDINAELINAYQTIRNHCEELIYRLATLNLQNMAACDKKAYYYEKRVAFNELKINGNEQTNLEKAALFIFLNKTCFNGLYRVNRKGEFNVPMGLYKNPNICDENNLKAVSTALQKVTIVCGDYKQSEHFIDAGTFVYFDPPYRPLNTTASFTTYTEHGFPDEKQAELATFAQAMAYRGAKVMVSNSDPKNVSEQDDFFDELYATFSIRRVSATRMINSNAAARGKISELLIVSE